MLGTWLDEHGNIVDPTRVDWQAGGAFVTPPLFARTMKLVRLPHGIIGLSTVWTVRPDERVLIHPVCRWRVLRHTY